MACEQTVKVRRRMFRLRSLITISLLAGDVCAQVPNAAPANPPASQTAPAKAAPHDPFGRDSPYGSVVGFLKAAGLGDYARATEYLDTRASPEQEQKLAEQLYVVLNHGLTENLEKLSRSPEGDVADQLRKNRDQVGSIETKSGTLNIVLDRVIRGNQSPVWLFSSETLRGVPKAFNDLKGTGIDRFIPQPLKDIKVFSLPLWRWIALILAFALAWISASLVTLALLPILRVPVRRMTGREGNRDLLSLKQPVRLLLLALAIWCLAQLSETVLARAFFIAVSNVVVVVGVSWLLIRFSDIISGLRAEYLLQVQQTSQIAILALGRRLFKILVVFVAVVFLLRGAGVDVSAMLAGLGIGGIALALGAQKTLEDLLGGITIITRQAVRLGDFCQLAGTTGTVEDIGLSSTRVRTPDRTTVSIPNAKISQMNIENYSMRDKIWFHHVFGLRYDTSPEQMRSLLGKINQMWREDPRVETDSARIRFIAFGTSSLNLEIHAYIKESDFAVFLAIQEELMLRIMDIISACGTGLALPSQITFLDHDKGSAANRLPASAISENPVQASPRGEIAGAGGKS
jgi:MscS family membrane protein